MPDEETCQDEGGLDQNSIAECGDPCLGRWHGGGERKGGLCAQRGRNGATEKGVGGNRSIPGLATEAC